MIEAEFQTCHICQNIAVSDFVLMTCMGQHMVHFNCLYNFFKKTEFNMIRCPNCRQGDGSFMLQTHVDKYLQKLYELQNNGLKYNESAYDWSENGYFVNAEDYIKVIPTLKEKFPKIFMNSENESMVSKNQMALFTHNSELILHASTVVDMIRQNKTHVKFVKPFIKSVASMEGWKDEQGKIIERNTATQPPREEETTGFSSIFQYVGTPRTPIIQHYNNGFALDNFSPVLPQTNSALRFPQRRSWQQLDLNLNQAQNLVIGEDTERLESSDDDDDQEANDEHYSTDETQEEDDEEEARENQAMYFSYEYIIVRNMALERRPDIENENLLLNQVIGHNISLYAYNDETSAIDLLQNFQYVDDDEFAIIMKGNTEIAVFKDAQSDINVNFPNQPATLESLLLSQNNHSFTSVGGVHHICNRIRTMVNLTLPGR